jgi:hypothetical protein
MGGALIGLYWWCVLICRVLAAVLPSVLQHAVQEAVPLLLQQVLQHVPVRAVGLLRQQGRVPLLQQLEDQARGAKVPVRREAPPVIPA